MRTRTLVALLLVVGCAEEKRAPAPKPAEKPAEAEAAPAKAAEPAAAPVAQAAPSEPETILDVTEGSQFDTTVANATGSKVQKGDDDEMKIYKQVRSRLPAVNRCYAQQRKLDPTLAGKMTVKITVAPAPKGTVTTAEITERSMRSVEVEGCVLGTLRQFAFQRSGKDTISVHLPLIFR